MKRTKTIQQKQLILLKQTNRHKPYWCVLTVLPCTYWYGTWYGSWQTQKSFFSQNQVSTCNSSVEIGISQHIYSTVRYQGTMESTVCWLWINLSSNFSRYKFQYSNYRTIPYKFMILRSITCDESLLDISRVDIFFTKLQTYIPYGTVR